MTTDVVLTFSAPARPLSMNEQPSRSVREREQLWRDLAWAALLQHFPGKGPADRRLPPSDVMVALPFPDARRRDPGNYMATVKRIVDGLVFAGAWPDDTAEYVTQHEPTLNVGERLVVVRIVPRDRRRGGGRDG